MGYTRRLETTGKVEVSEKLKSELETVYLYGYKKSMSTRFHYL